MQFRTRLFELDPDLPPRWGAYGVGWTVRQRHFLMRVPSDYQSGPEILPESVHHIRAIVGNSYEQDGYFCSKLAPELIIEAKDFDHAQRVMRLISAGYALTEMMLLDEDCVAVPDDPQAYPEGSASEMDSVLKRGSATFGHFRAARIAAAASKKMIYQHALAKYFHGFRMAGIHWMDTHPTRGRNLSTSPDPVIYTNFAIAIISFYSVIEELNAHVIASERNPSRLPDGSWNPAVLGDLRSRLVDLGIDPDGEAVWLLRGTPTRIERAHKPPSGLPTRWAKGSVRDRMIPLCDAISYAGLLRSRVSAHRTSARTRSLTIAHVCNLQMLARDLLLGVLGDDYTTPRQLQR